MMVSSVGIMRKIMPLFGADTMRHGVCFVPPRKLTRDENNTLTHFETYLCISFFSFSRCKSNHLSQGSQIVLYPSRAPGPSPVEGERRSSFSLPLGQFLCTHSQPLSTIDSETAGKDALAY